MLREAFYLPAHRNASNLPWPEARDILRPIFESESPAKWGHNIKSDLVVLRRHGLDVRGVDFDTMLASYAIDASRRSHSVSDLANDARAHHRHLRSRRNGTQSDLDCRGAGQRCCGAGRGVCGSFVSAAQIARAGLERVSCREALERDRALIEVLADMEMTGVRIDVEFLRGFPRAWRGARPARSLRLGSGGGAFQLGESQASWGNPVREIGTEAPAQDEDRSFYRCGNFGRAAQGSRSGADPSSPPRGLQAQIDVRGCAPGIGASRNRALHTNYSQAGATTGRLSSSEPNLQNVPIRTAEGREICKAFIPSTEGGALVSCDYSQIELRILAHMAQDENLLDAFRRDVDVHRATAAIIFGGTPETVAAEQRAQAKTINFAVIYGMGPVNLGRSLSTSPPRKQRAGSMRTSRVARNPRVHRAHQRSGTARSLCRDTGG